VCLFGNPRAEFSARVPSEVSFRVECLQSSFGRSVVADLARPIGFDRTSQPRARIRVSSFATGSLSRRRFQVCLYFGGRGAGSPDSAAGSDAPRGTRCAALPGHFRVSLRGLDFGLALGRSVRYSLDTGRRPSAGCRPFSPGATRGLSSSGGPWAAHPVGRTGRQSPGAHGPSVQATRASSVSLLTGLTVSQGSRAVTRGWLTGPRVSWLTGRQSPGAHGPSVPATRASSVSRLTGLTVRQGSRAVTRGRLTGPRVSWLTGRQSPQITDRRAQVERDHRVGRLTGL
jgi:hypothetical protein